MIIILNDGTVIPLKAMAADWHRETIDFYRTDEDKKKKIVMARFERSSVAGLIVQDTDYLGGLEHKLINEFGKDEET